MGGTQKLLVASSTGKGVASSSLMSMPPVSQRGSAPCQLLLNCLLLAADRTAVCAPGYTGRKRGEVVRTRTTVLQMHTRQWIGTYAGRGNGDYQGELALDLGAITTYLRSFALTGDAALVRLDGQYGDTVAIAQLIEAGVYLLTRARGYRTLEHPQIQQVLASPPTACMTRVTTNEQIEVFEGGWLHMREGLPPVRVIVTRYRAPEAGTLVRVGKRIDEWVYELFITTLSIDGFLVEDVLDFYHGRGAFEAVLADEDIEEDPDRWCSYTPCGQELWQIACQWVWNLRLALGQQMQAGLLREIEWAPAKEAPPTLVAMENAPEEYGPWQWARQFGAATGRFGAEVFTLQENGMLLCPARANLWLSEVRQENAFTQRAVYVASQTDCPYCELRGQCLGRGAKGNRALPPSVQFAVSCPILRLWSDILIFLEPSGGWMLQVEHFAARG